MLFRSGISIIGTFSGCSSKETKGEAVNVRVGYFPNITHAQALVGHDQGTFQKAIGAATDAGAIFVSRKGVVIKNLKDLSGKKIAVPQFGNTQDLTLRKYYLTMDLKIKQKARQ